MHTSSLYLPFTSLVTVSVLQLGGPEKQPVHSVTWSVQSERRTQRFARASLESYLLEEIGLFSATVLQCVAVAIVNSEYFPCVDVAVSLIFTQRLTLFFLLYSRNHLDDVIFICRAGVLLAAQTTSGATDCIGKSYGGSDCRIWIAKILKDFLCLFDKKSPTEISSFSSFVQVHAVQFTASLKCQCLIIFWQTDIFSNLT